MHKVSILISRTSFTLAPNANASPLVLLLVTLTFTAQSIDLDLSYLTHACPQCQCIPISSISIISNTDQYETITHWSWVGIVIVNTYTMNVNIHNTIISTSNGKLYYLVNILRFHIINSNTETTNVYVMNLRQPTVCLTLPPGNDFTFAESNQSSSVYLPFTNNNNIIIMCHKP